MVHPNVTCDKSGMNPIVGPRYNLKGHNYNLCEAEFNKLPPAEQVKSSMSRSSKTTMRTTTLRCQPKRSMGTTRCVNASPRTSALRPTRNLDVIALQPARCVAPGHFSPTALIQHARRIHYPSGDHRSQLILAAAAAQRTLPHNAQACPPEGTP